MASARDTTGIEERGMRIEGQLTNLGEPTVSLQKIQPEEKGYRHTKSPGVERVAPTRRRAAGNGRTQIEGSSKVFGRERKRTDPRWVEAVLVEHSTEGGGEKTAAE